jgi:hypothetical protein
LREPIICSINVTDDILGLFVSAVPGDAIALTNENSEGFSALCGEFQFGSFPQCLEAIKNTANHRLGHCFARREKNIQAHPNDASTLTSRMDSLE